MKNYILISSLVLIAIIAVALKSVDQDQKKVNYVIVTHESLDHYISIHYGSGKPSDKIKFKTESVYDKMIDVLSDLESQGYEIATSDTYEYNQIAEHRTVVITYTLRKVGP